MLIESEPASAAEVLAKLRELTSGLPARAPLEALKEIDSWVASIGSAERLTVADRLTLIGVLDQAAKNPHQTLAHQYVTAPPQEKTRAMRVWNTCFGFTKNLGTAYLRCIDDFLAARPGSEGIEEDLPVIAGRALRALTVRVKWTLQRYELVDERVWRELGQIYLFAEARGFTATRVAIYPGQHGESSVQEEFLKAMMLAVSGPDSLLVEKLHIAERIVAHFGRAFVIRPEPTVGCPFFYDLSREQPPARAYKSMARGVHTRFFGAGDAAHALRAFARRIEERGAVPNDVYLGGEFDSETVLSVIDHLEEHWSPVPSARSTARRALATRVTVVPGLPQTLVWLHAVERAGAVENADPAGAQNWIVYDMSEGGYGAIVPREQADWLQLGALVGLRTEAASACRVGVVRRIMQDDFGQRRVGIEVLGKFAFPVKISPAGGPATGRALHAAEDAILLSKQPDQKGELALLLAPGRFSESQPLQVHVRDKAYVVRPSTLIESAREFDWANFSREN